MNVVVCNAHDRNYDEMAAITQPTWFDYARRHHFAYAYDLARETTEGDAMKINCFKHLYETGQFGGDDLFFWGDIDALVMNSAIDVRDIWFEHANTSTHYMVGYDVNGMNTGTWLARFTSHAYHYLSVSLNASVAMGWADQVGLIQTALNPPFNEWVKYIPGKQINAFPYELYGWDSWAHKNSINNYEDGDFVLHVPGIEMPRRLELLREYAKLAK